MGTTNSNSGVFSRNVIYKQKMDRSEILNELVDDFYDYFNKFLSCKIIIENVRQIKRSIEG